MPLFEKKAYVMVEASSLSEAETLFAEIDGGTKDDIGIALDESPAYKVED